jgi:hypothetical protein
VLVTYFPNFWYFYWRAIVNSHCIPLSVALVSIRSCWSHENLFE